MLNAELSSVEETDDDQSWQVVGNVYGKDSNEYTIHQLQPSQSYQFCVSALNEVGEGRQSLPSSGLTIPQQAPSGPPRGVVGSPRSNSSIIVQWQPPERSQWNGPLLGYQISYKLAGYPEITLSYENITTASKNLAEIGHLEPFQEYDVAIAAYNSKGIGVFSQYVRVRTQEGRPVSPPEDIEALPLNSTALSVSWTPPHQRQINGINQGYKVIAVPIEGDSDATRMVYVVMSNTSNMVGRQNTVVTDLKKFTKYSISVLCFTSKGDGPKSQTVPVQTLEDVPDQVGSLKFGGKIDTRLEIIWSPPLKSNGIITGYVVMCRELNLTDWTVNVELPPDATNYTITGLAARTMYYIDVVAKNRMGIGASHMVLIESGVAPEKLKPPHVVAVKSIQSTSVQLQISSGFPWHSSIIQWIVEGEHRHHHQWKEFSVVANSTADVLLVTGLQPDTEYRLRLSVENAAGRGDISEPTEWFRTAPTAPSSSPGTLIIRALNSTAVLSTWMPLSEPHWNGHGRYYTIGYTTCADKNREYKMASSEDDNVLSLTISGLEEWTLYCFHVAACNERGCSDYSGATSCQTLESAPSAGPNNVIAETVNSSAIRVSWSDVPRLHKNGQILGYRVLYSSTLDSSDFVHTVFSESQKSALLTDLQKFTWYQILVVAFTRLGDGPTSFPVATTQTLDDVPGEPSGVYFPEVTESSVRIAWLPPLKTNGIITGYRVAYGKRPSSHLAQFSFSVIDESLGKDRLDYSVSNLESDTFYVFAVTAQTRHGWGASKEVEVFTTSNRRVPDPPSRPTIGPSQIGDRWVVITVTPEINAYAPIRNYTVQVKTHGGQFLTQAEFVPRNIAEYNITGLVPNTRYWLRMAASNDIQMSDFSNSSDPIHTHPAPPDHPPVDVVLVQKTPTSVLVRWKPARNDAPWNGDKIGYKIWYRQLHSDTMEGIDDHESSENSYQTVTTVYPQTNVVLSNLMSKAIYEVKVALINNVGHGPMSTPVDILLREAAPLSTPEDLQATALDSSSICVSWKSMSLPDYGSGSYLGFKVFFWIVGSRGNTTRVKHLALTDNQTIIDHLKMFTEYAFVVALFGAGGNGPNSSTPVMARTDDGLPGPPRRLTVFVTSQTSANITWEVPTEPNGVIEGYDLTYFQQTLVDGESKSVHVVLSSEKTNYHARDLMPEASYTFRLSAKTRHGSGQESSYSIHIGPQPGSPEAPDKPECSESEAGVTVTWNTPDAGSSPITSYILQYRQYDLDPSSTDWVAMPVMIQSPEMVTLESKVMLGSVQLVPGVTYQFRVFAVNSHGISPSSPTTEHMFSSAVVHAQSAHRPPFYQQWWFLMAVAIGGLIIILAVIVILCVTGRKRSKLVSKANSKKKRSGDAKTMQCQITTIDDETGFATIERRHLQSWGGQKYPKASTLPLYTKAPPRPSPGSIMYDTELISQHEDSGNVSDKASQNEDSDGETSENHLAAFLDHTSKRPQSLYDDSYPPYTINLNGGPSSAVPKYHTMRPTKLSSFA